MLGRINWDVLLQALESVSYIHITPNTHSYTIYIYIYIRLILASTLHF